MYEGRIFRPPSEANSLIIQVTVGCSHNACTFCNMYKEKSFRIKPIEKVLADINQIPSIYEKVKKIFIADGDALVIPISYWEKLIDALRSKFLRVERISCYASPKSVLDKRDQELARLKGLGIDIVYMGLESGSDRILKKIRKDVTSKEMIQAGLKLKSAGIRQSITVILGLGGRELSTIHIEDTAKVLNLMDPEYLGLLTLIIEEDMPIFEEVKSGDFSPLNEKEALLELRNLIDKLSLSNCILRSNHASNYIAIKGTLPNDKVGLVEKLDMSLINNVYNRTHKYRTL